MPPSSGGEIVLGWLNRRLVREQRRMAYMTVLALASLDGHAQGYFKIAQGDKSTADVPDGVSPEIDHIREMKAVVNMLEGSMRREREDGEDHFEPLGPAFRDKLVQIHSWTRRAYDALPISHHEPYERAFTPRGGWAMRGL